MYYQDPTSDLVYTYVPKNMSSTMSRLVVKHGWHKFLNIDLVPKHCHIFSIIQNPWIRFCKGMSENAWITNERSFEHVRKMPFYQMSFMNPHTMPISVLYPDAISHMNFVVMDHPDYAANDVLNNLFEQHGSTTRIEDTDIKHRSSDRKRAYQTEVRQWLESPRYSYRKQIIHLNQTDHNNWRAALCALDPQVESTSWYQAFLKRIWTSE